MFYVPGKPFKNAMPMKDMATSLNKWLPLAINNVIPPRRRLLKKQVESPSTRANTILMGLKNFPLFNALPMEIPIMIWVSSLTPATVYIRPVGVKPIEKPGKQENPILLQVCRESRLALSHYELSPDIDKT